MSEEQRDEQREKKRKLYAEKTHKMDPAEAEACVNECVEHNRLQHLGMSTGRAGWLVLHGTRTSENLSA